MDTQLHFAQKISRKSKNFAKRAQNDLDIMGVKSRKKKNQIFEKCISTWIFATNMTRFHIELVSRVVKISPQFFIQNEAEDTYENALKKVTRDWSLNTF